MIKGLVDSGVQKRQIYWEILWMIRFEYVKFLAVVGVNLTVNTLYYSAEEACANIRF
jgi:hypothetical protein